MKGKFITIEGGDGVGKSTNIACVESWLTGRGIGYIRTREPGGTPLAEDIRAVLLTPRDEPFCAKTELLLMFAARAQHLQEKILPALAKGQWVVCDRFTDATYAYQGGGRNLPLAWIDALAKLVLENFKPDLTILLDADVAVGLARAASRGEPDRFEREQVAFYERIRTAYLARVEADPGRFAVIDAGQTLVDVQKDIVRALDTFAACEA